MRHGDFDGDHILLSRLAILERRMAAMADLLAAATPAEDGDSGLPASLCVEPDSQTELAQGFYLREHDAAGRPFRWAGRDPYFEFRFFIDRATARPFRMRGLLAPAAAIAAASGGLTGFVDYRAIPLRVAADGEMTEISGRIPADRLNPGVTLTFFCPAAPSPNPQDGRRLSFAFTGLVVGHVQATEQGSETAAREVGAGGAGPRQPKTGATGRGDEGTRKTKAAPHGLVRR